jgi:hypothetical protein
MNRRSLVVALLALVALVLVSSLALARVRHDGAWPAQEKPVTLKLQATPRADAVRALAKAAGWNVVVHAPKGDPVDVEVTDVAPSKVLDMLLSDRSYVASRDGNLISIDIEDAASPDSAIASIAASAAASALGLPPPPPVPPTPPTPPTPPSPNAAVPSAPNVEDAPPPAIAPSDAPKPSPSARVRPAHRGKDRNITGENLVIGKDEVVQDVVVFGGNVDIYGTVTGDISVTGGNLRVHESGWILGDAAVIGGNITLDGASQVDGDVSVMGGNIKRSDRCHIGGDVESDHKSHDSKGHDVGRGILGGIGGAITRGAMLFVFGAVLLALAAKRMETLRVEVASRPMRSFATGVLGVLGGVVLFIAFCVTIIGIPIALIGLFLSIIGGYAGVCAVLTVVGQALLKHKTESPYVHLAVGCALFIVVGAIPFVGHLVTIGVALVGIGVLVATRAAGLVQKKNGVPSSGPYRSAAEA